MRKKSNQNFSSFRSIFNFELNGKWSEAKPSWAENLSARLGLITKYLLRFGLKWSIVTVWWMTPNENLVLLTENVFQTCIPLSINGSSNKNPWINVAKKVVKIIFVDNRFHTIFINNYFLCIQMSLRSLIRVQYI